MKWCYAVLAAVWALIAGIDASRGEWGAVALDVVFLGVTVGMGIYLRRRDRGRAEAEREVLRYLKAVSVDDLAKKGVEPMPTPGDEYQRLVEDHIKGCRTCQVHEEGKSE